VDEGRSDDRRQLRRGYGADKPDTGIFTYTSEQLGVSPAECVYVGDHPRNDIEGARNAGMRTIWYAGFVDWDDRYRRADAQINGLDELRQHL
jgi:putative hydrolase of the HAD superfamily